MEQVADKIRKIMQYGERGMEERQTPMAADRIMGQRKEIQQNNIILNMEILTKITLFRRKEVP